MVLHYVGYIYQHKLKKNYGGNCDKEVYITSACYIAHIVHSYQTNTESTKSTCLK